MNVLLSIKPEFADKILCGKKRYEFRKTRFTQAGSGSIVYLYSSSPVQRIVGHFTISDVVSSCPEGLWDQFGEHSGIKNRERFLQYFNGTDIGYAIGIEDFEQLDEPVDPREFFEDFRPPVSFQYVNGELDTIRAL